MVIASKTSNFFMLSLGYIYSWVLWCFPQIMRSIIGWTFLSWLLLGLNLMWFNSFEHWIIPNISFELLTWCWAFTATPIVCILTCCWNCRNVIHIQQTYSLQDLNCDQFLYCATPPFQRALHKPGIVWVTSVWRSGILAKRHPCRTLLLHRCCRGVLGCPLLLPPNSLTCGSRSPTSVRHLEGHQMNPSVSLANRFCSTARQARPLLKAFA